MDKIKAQASIVGQLLFAGDTGEIYKKTLTRTWDILREVGVLMWLVLCLTFVGGDWFYRTAVGLGRSTRAWYIGLSEKSDSAEPASMTASGQVLLDTVQSGAAKLLSQARRQLGIPDPEPMPTVAAPAPAAPAPAPAPAAPAPAAPVVTAPAEPLETAASSPESEGDTVALEDTGDVDADADWA